MALLELLTRLGDVLLKQKQQPKARGGEQGLSQGVPPERGGGGGSVSGQPRLHRVDPLGPVGEVLVDFRLIVQLGVAAATAPDRV